MSLCVLSFSFCFLGDISFFPITVCSSLIFCTIVVSSLCGEYVVRFPIFQIFFFSYLVTTGGIKHELIMREFNQSNSQSKNKNSYRRLQSDCPTQNVVLLVLIA